MTRKRTPDLSGVDLKMDRAKHHIETLRSETKAFLEREPEPLGFRTEETPGLGKEIKYVLYAVVREEPPPDLGFIAGDAIQNIRHALDYLAYELSSPAEQKRRNTQFPIFDDKCRFEVLGTPKIKSISGDERALIERVQPNNASKVARGSPLFLLNQLANQDKHRLLLPVAAAASQLDTWIESGNATIRITKFWPGPVEHDTEIMAFTATPEGPSQDMHVKPKSGLEIQFKDVQLVTETGAVFYREISDILDVLWGYVRQTVIDLYFTWGQLPPTWAEIEAASG